MIIELLQEWVQFSRSGLDSQRTVCISGGGTDLYLLYYIHIIPWGNVAWV
jgi:hypothetical protein